MRLLCHGSGDPILFIHGIPTSNQLWTGIIDRLRGHFTCFAVDLPGLGQTPPRACGIGQLRHLAEELDEVRFKAGVERWHVVGHDAGSAIAVSYAHMFPQHVNCLSLMAPALFPELRPYYLFEVLRKPLLGELLAPCINPIIWRIVMERACFGEDGAATFAVRDFRAPFTGPLGAWNMMRLLRWGNPSQVLADIPRILPQLRAPTLIFHGANDRAIPAAFARRASTLIPNAELVVIDGGHFLPLNRPDSIARSLHAFLKCNVAGCGDC